MESLASEFWLKSIFFQEHIILEDRIFMDPWKVEAI